MGLRISKAPLNRIPRVFRVIFARTVLRIPFAGRGVGNGYTQYDARRSVQGNAQ